MPEFEMLDSFDDIVEGIVAEPAVYQLILQGWEKARNKADTGDNIVLSLVITGSNTEADGIGFSHYMSLPTIEDNEKFTKNKQSYTHMKLGMIKKTVEALGGKTEGRKFHFPDNAMCKASVLKLKNLESGRDYNQIDGDLMPYKPTKKKAS
jgi:hypothetical protein